MIAMWPGAARADSALLGGFSFGGALLARSSLIEPELLVGAGLDWITADGLTVAARVRTDQILDTSIALDAGWLGPGLLENRGLPLGFALGPALSIDPEARSKIGGRARLALGLWYARVAIELDTTAWRRLGAGESTALEWVFALAIRFVPWAPWRL
jgi:hypothetical protein